jgi:hypothetical protein
MAKVARMVTDMLNVSQCFFRETERPVVGIQNNAQRTAELRRNVSSSPCIERLSWTKVEAALMATESLPSNPEENVAPLVAQLSRDGIAGLQGNIPGSYERPGLTTADSTSTSSSTPEPMYEELEGLILDARQNATAKVRRNGQHQSTGEATARESQKGNRPSITVKLEKIDKAGHYKVHTADSELRALLKQGFERSKNGEIKKKRSRFSDLVFTQQFTAFDRQNPASSASIFHGFFSLFWLVCPLP